MTRTIAASSPSVLSMPIKAANSAWTVRQREGLLGWVVDRLNPKLNTRLPRNRIQPILKRGLWEHRAARLTSISRCGDIHHIFSILTFSTPAESIPICIAAPIDKSISRPFTKGPRSLILTTTDFFVRRFVTLTFVPKGSVRCAAVNACLSNFSPLAVIFPCLYHEATQGPFPACPNCAGTNSKTSRNTHLIISLC